jgi:small-conductance mechanosensitive channel
MKNFFSKILDKVVNQHILNQPIFSIGGTPVDVGSIIVFVLILAITLVISKLLEAAVVRAFNLRRVADEGTAAVTRRLVHYVVLLTGLAVGLSTLGIDLSALFAAGALFAVALGFAMQNIAQNFVSGVILLVERSIKPGDILEVEGKVVRVSRMGIRSTVSRTLNDEEIIIPNSTLVQNSVKNYTMQDSIYRLRAGVGVTYSSDLALVRKTLEEIARDLPWRLKSREPRILLRQFGSSSVDYELSVWIDHPWRAFWRLSELNEAIWWAFKEKNITIAFPQLDLHLDPPVTEGLTHLTRIGPNGSGASGVG